MPFALEYDDMRTAFLIASGFAGAAIVLSLSILLASLWIYLTPSARSHIERLSWRLFMVILALQVVWATMYLITYADADLARRVGESNPGCSVVMLMMVGCRLTISWLITCIAVNLALNVRWDVNCTKKGLGKWYIIGSSALGFAPPLVAAATGHFRGGARYNTCYFAAVRPYRKYLLRVFLAFHLWLALATIIALIAVVISMTSIFTQARRTSRLLRQAAKHSHAALHQSPSYPARELEAPADEKTAASASESASTSGASTGSLACFGPRQTTNKRDASSSDHPRMNRRMSMYSLDDAFLRIAVRVAVYPVAAVILNAIYIATDVFFYLYPKDLPDSYGGLYVLGFVLYAGRGAIFAIIAILIDPCFRQGLKAAWKARSESKTPCPESHLSIPISPRTLLQPLAKAQLRDPVSPTCSFWDMMESNPKRTPPLSSPVSPLMLVVTPQAPYLGARESDGGEAELEVKLGWTGRCTDGGEGSSGAVREYAARAAEGQGQENSGRGRPGGGLGLDMSAGAAGDCLSEEGGQREGAGVQGRRRRGINILGL